MDIAADDRVVAAFLIDTGVVGGIADFDVINDHKTRSGRVQDINVPGIKDGIGPFKDQPTSVGGAAGLRRQRGASQSYVRPVDFGFSLNDGHLARVIGEQDGVVSSTGLFLQLSGRFRYRVWKNGFGIGAPTEADGLASFSGIESLLHGLPRFSSRAGLLVRPRR